ncbi:helix-turn-helix domain-containing protein [Crossiella cryophila]|uniref:Transcriptional regulator GlxA family with amidase domain n=1 Tax=Crossiella cryophila TaxID=43355 RepID=A0A7W7CCF5_9PSEU|nr:helix-turn-helix domain-containing protein [Crossiella cryophila]MBB4678467.1 transcriptional regulator GlxA family with amidase domain [Crossiella cryophila]
MRSVVLALYEGAMLFEAATAIEVFGVDRGDLGSPWYDFTVCGPKAAQLGAVARVPSSPGFAPVRSAHTVIIPAYHDVDRDPPADIVNALRAAHARGARIVSLCTGSFVLAAAGLLSGRRVTTHWAHAEQLASRYPDITVDAEVLYVDDHPFLSSAGKAACMDLSLHIVRTDYGATTANALARSLVVPPHRAGGQAQFITAPAPPGGTHLQDLMRWATEHLHEPLTVQDLATRASMSTRNLARHFIATTGTTPLHWLHNQRVHRAQELLETTDASVDVIAERTGMGTAATLRRHFNQTVGVAPDTYRRTFRGRRTTPPNPP